MAIFVVKKSSRSKKWDRWHDMLLHLHSRWLEGLIDELNNRTGYCVKRGQRLMGSSVARVLNPLVSSKQNRMIKKALKISIRGTDLQVISYYTVEDIIKNLPTPSQDRNLQGVRLRQALIEIYAAALGGPSLFAENEFYGRPSSATGSSPTKTGAFSLPPPTQTASFSVGHQP